MKKAAARKITGNKSGIKKLAIKKPAARKVAAKKPVAKKLTAKKVPIRKAVAKKAVKPVKAAVRKKPVKVAAPLRPVKATAPKPVKVAPPKPVKAKAPARPAKAPEAPKPELLAIIEGQLDDAKAEHITTVGLDGKSAIADFMVVASGRSSRHVGAIADQLVEKLKERGYRDLRIEGMPQCDWVLVDAGDVVVHLFRPEVRSFYNLEKLWSAHAPEERAVG